MIASLFKKVPTMLRENILRLSESVFQRKQNNLCFTIYLLLLAAGVRITDVAQEGQGQKVWGDG